VLYQLSYVGVRVIVASAFCPAGHGKPLSSNAIQLWERGRAMASVEEPQAAEREDGRPRPEYDAERLLELYRLMVLIREFEPETERQYKKANIGGYCHLVTGSEASNVGPVAAMEDGDYMLGSYRDHGLALARGVSARAVMAELFGRVDGCAHGRGGSMHLLDVGRNFLGGWGIVGGQVPVATGVAFAVKRDGKPNAVLCEMGDGATNIGAFHEALNLAGLWRLPIVYLVINNVYGMGTSVRRASAEPELHRRACAYRMHGERVDGDDLEEVLEASERLLRAAREERAPAILECETYRYRGHSVADAGLNYRTREEIAEHREHHDPIRILGHRLVERGAVDADGLKQIEREAREAVEDAVAFAERSPAPEPDTLAEHVYGDPRYPEQFSRMRPGSPFGEEELVFERGLAS
jgi:pyruvate dehydrogenase E1 component alpha subunit